MTNDLSFAKLRGYLHTWKNIIMAVTIIKPKIKDVSKIDSTEIITAELVDEFATLSAKLQKQLEKIKPLQNSVTVMEIGILVAVDEVVDPRQKSNQTGH